MARRDLLIIVATLTLVSLLAARVFSGYLRGDLIAGDPAAPSPRFFLVAPDGSLLVFSGTISDPRFSVWSSETEVGVPIPIPETARMELTASTFLPEASVWKTGHEVVVPGCSHDLAASPAPPTLYLPSWRRETRTSCWRWFRFSLNPVAPTVSLAQEPKEHPELLVFDWFEGLSGSLEGRRVLASGLSFESKGRMDSRLDLIDARGGRRRLTRHSPLFVAGVSPRRATLSPDGEFLAYELGGSRGFGWGEEYVVRRRDGRRWHLVAGGVGIVGKLQWRPGQPHELYGSAHGGIYSWTLPE
jgi:hypothetical protein